MKFIPTQQIDKWLENFNVDFEVMEVPFDKIDRRASRENHARLAEPIISDHVEKLAASASDNAVFPALICARRGSKYVILDGNHRDEANLRNGASDPLCYVVKTDDTILLDVIARCANRDLNGEPQSKDEAIEHAIYLVRHHKLKPKDAARCTRISVSTLNQRIAVDDIRSELAPHVPQISRAKNLQVSAVKPLLGITNVASAVLDHAIARGLTSDQTKAMVSAIEELPKDEDTRLRAINSYVKNHCRPVRRHSTPADKHVRAGNSLRAMLSSLVVHLKKFPDCAANAVSGIDEKAVLKRSCEDTIEAIQTLVKSMKR